jgi:GH43 family beta-xylosidase
MGPISFFDLTCIRQIRNRFFFAALLVLPASTICHAQMFENPLFASQDPYVTYWNGNYYYSDSANNSIRIRKSASLTGFKTQTPYIAWKSPWIGQDGHANLWAPEIHQIDGVWYIYFSADFQSSGRHHLYVLKGGAHPLDPYSLADTGYPQGQLVESTGKWAADPDVFYAADGQLYLTWSCTTDDIGKAPQNLCIARMKDALHVGSATSQISTPTEAWEKRTGLVEEGPVGFVHNGNTYITFSASASWTPNDYNVGVLVNTTGDLLDSRAWTKRGPIFDHHGLAYGPGSVVFVPSADGTELWSLYHAYDRMNCAAWTCRTIRMQKVAWDANGLPLLGYPMNPGIMSRAPSGDMDSPTGWGDSTQGTAANGTWRYNSASSVDFLGGDSTSGTVGQTFRDNPNPVAYTVSARVQLDGGTGQAGVFAVYKDATHHVEAYLDSQQGAFVTNVSGPTKNAGQSTCTLDIGFDLSAPHELQVVKSADGTFSFYLDRTLMEQRTLSMGHGAMGVLAASAGAHFRDVAVKDTSFGWGDAYGDFAQGFPKESGVETGTGYVQGNWSITDGSTAESAGSGWNTIYQGNPNFINFTVQVDTELEGSGTPSQTRYGLVVCHDDRNNQLTLWIDQAQNILTWNAVVQGQSSWQSVTLPQGFYSVKSHHLSATKAGPQFTFSLDGYDMAKATYDLPNGTSGLAAQNARVQFSNYSVVDQ